ncbi:hypothetical protein BpHYR1_024415 [Brachionus plicatilis]|uniref:Uncharacterized protein n=1 Tax=Brachionus plicatilis TaxID=10195 RepID=A0A3M7S5V1_BRAPC|nr:hypothetical protein BpHYR1_024415 [Brachionus plicatilis]
MLDELANEPKSTSLVDSIEIYINTKFLDFSIKSNDFTKKIYLMIESSATLGFRIFEHFTIITEKLFLKSFKSCPKRS